MSGEVDFEKLKAEGAAAGAAGGSLAGAVDLNNPMQLGIAKFKEFMLEQDGRAFVCVGMTGQGQVVVLAETPGGKIEQLGMLQFALAMASPAIPQQGPPPGAEYEDVPDQEPEQASD